MIYNHISINVLLDVFMDLLDIHTIYGSKCIQLLPEKLLNLLNPQYFLRRYLDPYMT